MPLYDLTIEPLLDRIATHLATQYRLSLYGTHGSSGCANRSPYRDKCAVGCLISDEQMQRFGVARQDAVHQLKLELLDELRAEYTPNAGGPEFFHALRCAQRYHDGADTDHTPSYSERLEQYRRDDPGLQPKILDDLRVRYCTSRMNE